jgi:predicted MPP superfamily phosphohydrolase
MSKHILHISDLHLEDFKPKDKEIIKSRFQERNFEDKFFSKLKKSGVKLDYVIITGDLANIGTKEDYEVVNKFLSKFTLELKIDKENILICPGNHDINWQKSKLAFHSNAAKSLKNSKDDLNENESYKHHKEKFEDFIEFYNNFYSSDNLKFDPEVSVFRSFNISIDDAEIQFCMINSCWMESHFKDNHHGYVNHASFESFLKTQDESILKVALLHHVPIVMNDTKSIKNWDEEIKYLCNKHNVRLFLFGHQHISQVNKIKEGENEFLQLSVGALGKNEIGVQNTFNLLSFSYNDENSLLEVSKTPYQYIEHGTEPDWIPLDAYKVVENLAYKKTAIKEPNPVDLLGNIVVNYEFPKKIELFSNRLIEIITKDNLFSSGHYHWNTSTRTLGFIDTFSLLSKRTNSMVAKGGILELYNSHNLDSDFIIGLGQEGNVLGGFLAMNKGLPFSSIPYYSRKDDYSIHEKDLNLNSCKKITIVTDVIYSASSVKSIIDEKVKSFENVTQINLLSLFYISKEKAYNPRLFSTLDSRLMYYTVSDKIKIDKCMCKHEEYEKCTIFCNKLEKVHVFHS